MKSLPLSLSSTHADNRCRRHFMRLAVVIAVAVAAMATESHALAQCPGGFGGGGFGFQPFGFYQPYGIQYRSSVPTPPYFSVNPPVYYGTRHFRPYGLSPFAAPPQVSASSNYQSQSGASGIRQRQYGGPVSNPFICVSNTGSDRANRTGDSQPDQRSTNDELVTKRSFTAGQIQNNPFVDPEVHFAKR